MTIDGDSLVVYNAPIARRKLGLAGIPGSGTVVGPFVSTDNAIARYDGATGQIIQNSAPIVEDDGRISTVTDPTLAQDAATKAYVDAAIAAIVVGGVGAVLRGSGPPVAAPATPAAGAIYYDDDIASPSYDTAWHWSVPGQIWIGA